LDFILHIAYVIDACVLPKILPSLSVIDDVLYTGEETDAGIGLGRRRRLLDIWISLLHIVKRVRNSTARFLCVFDSTEDSLNVQCILRIQLCAYLLSSLIA
jgi:hypothetical protein